MTAVGYTYLMISIVAGAAALAVWLHDRKRDRHDHKAHG